MASHRDRFAARPRRRRAAGTTLARSRHDAAAFREFYELYAERVVVFFARRTISVDLAADLTSETFALAFERRHQFRGSTPEEEQGWLFAIARSQISAFWRHAEVEQRALARLGLDPISMTSHGIERIEELAGLAELRQSVAHALEDLPEDQAGAIEQRILLERSYSEVAHDFGVTEDVVRARVSRGLRAMAARLGTSRPQELL
jgi:RNA polymerase sigma factor (sigma-70 family)